VDWVYLTHEQSGGAARFPDEPGVVAWHEAHGWVRADEPEPVPFVPPKGTPTAVDGFVQLVHPDLPGVTHEWPDNPEALQGAREAGWDVLQPEPEPDSKPAKKPAKKAAEPADEKDEG
jgi:hypothetical protein